MYLLPYQQYLLIIRVPFTYFAKIRFKQDHFPLIINVPLYPVFWHVHKLTLIVIIYVGSYPFSFFQNFFQSLVNIVTRVTVWTTETRDFSVSQNVEIGHDSAFLE